MFKNSIFSITNNILQLVVSIFTAYFISRGLGVYGKGVLYLITQIYVIFQLFFSFGLGQSILFNIKNGSIPSNRIRSFTYCFLFFLLLIFTVIYLNRHEIILNIFGAEISENETILMLVISFLGVANLLFGYELMSDSNKIKSSMIISIISNISYLTLIMFCYYFFTITILSVLFSLFVSIILKTFFTFFSILNCRSKLCLFNLSDAKKLFSFGAQFLLNSFFLNTVYRIDTFFLSHYRMVDELGIYSVSVTVSELILIVPNAIGVILFPHLAGLNEMDKTNMIKFSSRINLLIGTVSALFCAFLGSYFINIIFGKQFSESYYILLCLLPGIIAMAFNITFSNYISSIGKPLLGTAFYLIATLVNVVLNFFFISKYGLYAVSINASLSYILTSFLFVRYVLKKDQINLIDLTIPTKEDVTILSKYFKKLIIK
jgi:O-antigen/teichoic acid export membrane protein